ncbi:MAG: ABC transporter ATP-binding protein [Gemmatimonadales bacterium]
MTAAIETHGLGKRYGRVTGLEDLSFRIEEGEVFGFLGPNGAGKTTTIRLLLGLIAPTTGGATVLGHDVRGPDVSWRGGVGYLPGELALWPALTGARTLTFLESLTGRKAVRRRELLERLGLPDSDLARRVGTWSDGMKQKLGLVQALQCEPALVLLDEPTKGLDPLVQQEFYELIAELGRAGTTVFFSSHVLSEVERVSSRVGMLKDGRLVGAFGVEELRRAQRRRVVATFAQNVDATTLAAFGEITAATERRVELLVVQERIAALVVRLGVLPLADLVIEPARLEDAFLERYQ